LKVRITDGSIRFRMASDEIAPLLAGRVVDATAGPITVGLLISSDVELSVVRDADQLVVFIPEASITRPSLGRPLIFLGATDALQLLVELDLKPEG